MRFNWETSGISSGLPESQQFAEFESDRELPFINRSYIFKYKKKNVLLRDMKELTITSHGVISSTKNKMWTKEKTMVENF